MKIKVFTECEVGCGIGHVSRCLNMSAFFIKAGYSVRMYIRGDNVISANDFIGREISCWEAEFKQSLLYTFVQWMETRDTEILSSDISIIDSYKLEDADLIAENSKVTVIYDDDLRHKNLRDEKGIIILNTNGAYADKGLLGANVLSGVSYHALPLAFSINRKKSHEKDIDLLLCFGGEDIEDISHKALKIVKTLDKKKIVVVVGSGYKGKLIDQQRTDVLAENRCVRADNVRGGQVEVYRGVNSAQMSELMARSKMGIVSGGGILLEAMYMDLKSIVIKTASNQDTHIEQICRNDMFVHSELYNLKEALHYMDKKYAEKSGNSPDIGKSVSTKASSLVSKAVVTTINISLGSKYNAPNYTLHKEGIEAIDFCNATSEQIELILTFRNHPNVRKFMYQEKEITREEHAKFVINLRNDDESKYFMVKELGANNYIGVISLTEIDNKSKNAYLGIYKNPLEKHAEYGKILMRVLKHIAFETMGLRYLYLEVIEDNKRAERFYQKESFEKMGTLKEAHHKESTGEYLDVHIYGIRNSSL